MQLEKPKWYLKYPCPCCGQGHPSFCVCPTCAYLTVICDEMGNTFIQPRNLELGFAEICPNCEKTKTEDFIIADADNILKAGFTKDEYE